MTDWTGNKKSTFVTLGASSHSDHEREQNDYYATDPKCAEDLLKILPEIDNIWECACGEGHLSKVFQKHGKIVKSTDLINRNFGASGINFLQQNNVWSGDIVTNPPYKYAKEFVEKSMQIIPTNRYVCMFLKITFLESDSRKKRFEKYPPKFVYVYSNRQKCAINGDFDNTGSSAACYAWFIWQKGFKGETILRWI